MSFCIGIEIEVLNELSLVLHSREREEEEEEVNWCELSKEKRELVR